jgi:hypothetical protein
MYVNYILFFVVHEQPLDISQNVTIMEMETANLSCPLNFSESIWWRVFAISREEDPIDIYSNDRFTDPFEKTGRYHVMSNVLTIDIVTVTDAGRYDCSTDGLDYISLHLNVGGMNILITFNL